jgi:hypothetical protein
MVDAFSHQAAEKRAETVQLPDEWRERLGLLRAAMSRKARLSSLTQRGVLLGALRRGLYTLEQGQGDRMFCAPGITSLSVLVDGRHLIQAERLRLEVTLIHPGYGEVRTPSRRVVILTAIHLGLVELEGQHQVAGRDQWG